MVLEEKVSELDLTSFFLFSSTYAELHKIKSPASASTLSHSQPRAKNHSLSSSLNTESTKGNQ